MRFRLLRRRLTISAPSMAIRSAMPWPLRWALAAVVLGFCAAIGLWAFELGKEIAGLDKDAREELQQLRAQATQLREDRDKAQSIANTSGSLLTAEKAAQEQLIAQVKKLEQENRALRDDLGFFEKLIPGSGQEGLSIRGLQGEVITAGTQFRWQVLMIQAQKNAPIFNGKLDIQLAGSLGGKPWSQSAVEGGQPLQVQQYRRLEGLVDLPPQVVVKQLTVRVMEGNQTRAVQTLKL